MNSELALNYTKLASSPVRLVHWTGEGIRSIERCDNSVSETVVEKLRVATPQDQSASFVIVLQARILLDICGRVKAAM